ncbi:hypothetical protein BCR33DRAFT_666361 [Rhizoclosmatium globosum]|uniref:C2H2-type domain-containing protein n=1 Tax=Rhizoclosmatium globosum TaxID=329046 RepID=A0A1Y2B5N5_9FUNG|nr:hypothetical protein BCR33DRAFT_666361 [Rhizoclosmatium globosum]|eukprot:ORY30149.1 hypothetical protein BCR33DRAFT_666361 [Rhizoclosmatium globosum]
MEDLTALLQLANNKNVNLGAQNLALLQQQLSAASNSVAPAAGPSKAFDLRHKAGGKAEQAPRRRPSKFYTCSFPNCGKQFTRAFNLKTHEQTHDVDRPRDFVCEEPGCGKTFVRIHDLSRHAVAHDQSKWHFCGTCNRGFARIDALKRHEKSTASCRGDEVVA